MSPAQLHRPCIDCGIVAPGTRCPTCERIYQAARARRPKAAKIWRTARWQETSRRAIRRDGECQLCGATTNLTAHHLHYDAPFDTTTIITLCRTCHGKASHTEQ